MARKLSYIATKTDGTKETLKFTSYYQAQSFVERHKDQYEHITFADDPSDIAYLSKLSWAMANEGENNLYVIAKPFTNAKFWKNPRDTHYMNIVEMLPGYVAHQWRLNNEEYDEADDITDNTNIFAMMGLYPSDIIGKPWKEASAAEIEHLVKFIVKNFYGGTKLIEKGGRGVPYSFINFIEEIPNEKITPDTAKIVQKLVLEKHHDVYGGEYPIHDLPDAIWKDKDFINKILTAFAKNEYYPYSTENMPSHILDYAEKVLPQFKDMYDQQRKYNSERDERTRQVQAEREREALARQQESDRIQAAWDAMSPEEKKQYRDKQSQVATKDHEARGWSEEKITQFIKSNPSNLFHIPADMRTFERWVLAASLNPKILNGIPASQPDLKSKIEAELAKTGEGDLQRIKQLSGNNPTEK